eukprot:4534822-Amphidinium_carterae.1
MESLCLSLEVCKGRGWSRATTHGERLGGPQRRAQASLASAAVHSATIAADRGAAPSLAGGSDGGQRHDIETQRQILGSLPPSARICCVHVRLMFYMIVVAYVLESKLQKPEIQTSLIRKETTKKRELHLAEEGSEIPFLWYTVAVDG